MVGAEREGKRVSACEQDVTVVVRAAGERTADLCYRLAAEQAPPGSVFLVQESPSAVALRKVLEIGIQQGRTWTIELDADMLIRRDAVRLLLEGLEAPPPDVFTIKGCKLDKLFAGVREGGMHVYRTAHLREALEVLPRPEEAVRPDTTLVERMRRRGYRRILRSEVVSCVHDYEQYFRDIYRKAFVHARKHLVFMPYLLRMWQRLGKDDFDYQVAIWGARAGLSYDGPFTIDVRSLPQEIVPLLAMAGRVEKAPQIAGDYTASSVSTMIDSHQPPPEYERFEWMLHSRPRHRKLAAAIRRVGYLRFAPWLLGVVLKQSGERLETWANPNPPG
jgi:hypothetical protein